MLPACTVLFFTVPSVLSPGMPVQVDAVTAGQPLAAARVTPASTSRVLGVHRSRKPCNTRAPALVASVTLRGLRRRVVAPVSTEAVAAGTGAVSAAPTPTGSAGSGRLSSEPPPPQAISKVVVDRARIRGRNAQVGFRLMVAVKLELQKAGDSSKLV